MAFNSISFVLFFIIVTVLYYILPHRFRWALLLIASYFFYMCWNAEYAILMFTSTVITFVTGRFIYKTSKKRRKKLLLALSLVTNLGILAVFKYFNFANETMGVLVSKFGLDWTVPNLNVLLPIGISFYTFQALSYSMDVYRGDIEPIHNLGKYALFDSFFPQLVAGPIERSTHLIPQFEREVKFDLSAVKSGLLLASWGFFKKIVIADRVALLVNEVFNNIGDFQGSEIVFATLLFAVQIYCDFSAYSDIARGVARALGFDLMKNFNAPYLATSIHDFWKRWHISLTSWFRDYLYIPMGGSRVSKPRFYLNLVLVFLISGLWHGANFTFLIWGGIHAVYQIIGHLTKSIRSKAIKRFKIKNESSGYRTIQRVFVFILVCFAWIFFRANSLADAFFAVKQIALIKAPDFFNFIGTDAKYSLGLEKVEFIVVMVGVLLVYLVDRAAQKKNIIKRISDQPIVVRWVIYLAILFSIIIFGAYGGNLASEFIYFQF